MEYALLLAFVAMISISAVTMVGNSTSGTASVLGETLDRSGAPAAAGPPSAVTPSTVVGATVTTCAGNSGDSSGNQNGNNCHQN